MSKNPDSAKKKVWGWVFALSNESFQRIVFAVPYKRLLIIATIGAIILSSLILIIPKESYTYLRPLAMWGLLSCWAYAVVYGLFTRRELVLDLHTRKVKLRFTSLSKTLRWKKRFDDIEQVHMYKIKDTRDLHNHWKISLAAFFLDLGGWLGD
jgi:hypothetical protein